MIFPQFEESCKEKSVSSSDRKLPNNIFALRMYTVLDWMLFLKHRTSVIEVIKCLLKFNEKSNTICKKIKEFKAIQKY